MTNLELGIFLSLFLLQVNSQSASLFSFQFNYFIGVIVLVRLFKDNMASKLLNDIRGYPLKKVADSVGKEAGVRSRCDLTEACLANCYCWVWRLLFRFANKVFLGSTKATNVAPLIG